MAKWIWAALLVAALGQGERKYATSYLGKAPPELVSLKSQWMNAAEPLTLEGLKGKVVWLEFGFLRCGPCRKMKAVLSRWTDDYGKKGLVVIDIDDGSQDDLAEVKKVVLEKGEKFATLWDQDGKNCAAYGIEAFPAAYLVGVGGKVLWEGIPNAQIADLEKLIAGELSKVK